MPELSAYFAYREQLLDRTATTRKDLEQTPLPSGYRALLEAAWSLAGIAVVVKLGDDEIRRHIADAVDAADGWLTAGSHDGWHIGVFSTVLETLTAFGSAEQARAAAGTREEWYRSSEIVVEEAVFTAVRATKSWLLGDDAAARSACRDAVSSAREPMVRANAAGLAALLDGVPAGFHATIADALAGHKRMFAKLPHRPDGMFALPSLALCRMARTYGIEREEATYLPVRFLAVGSVRHG